MIVKDNSFANETKFPLAEFLEENILFNVIVEGLSVDLDKMIPSVAVLPINEEFSIVATY